MPATIRVGRVALDVVELLLAHHRERAEDGEEADRVQGEADAGADGRDQDSGDGRSNDPRPVEEPGVESDGVRKLARADHLERERLTARRVEGQGDATERGEHVDDGQGGGSGQRDDGKRDRDDHGGRLRGHDELP